MKRIVIVLLFLMTDCVSKPPKPFISHVPAGVGNPSARLVFPYGHYIHDVELIIRQGKRKFSFQGVVETRPDRILLTALSPFQTTMMRVVEDRRSGEVRLDCYMSELKRYQTNFNDYYQLVRQILTMEQTDDDAKGQRTFALAASGRPSTGILTDYENSIPRRIEINDPRFALAIKVTDVAMDGKR